VSELLEKIGLHQIQLTIQEQSSLADISIYRRLKSLIGEPVAVFWSVLSFMTRIYRQFGLEPTDEKLYTLAMQACTIVFYTGYLYPDLHINNPSALLRWLCYRILKAEVQPKIKQKKSRQVGKPADEYQVKQLLGKIGSAFDFLETAARSPDYEALKMKTIDGLTIQQISRVFKLQGLEVDTVEVGWMIKRGLANFRLLSYSNSGELPASTETISARKQVVWQMAYSYIEWALQETLWNSLEQIEEMLIRTSRDPYLDFWLNEIDYAVEQQNTNLRDRIAETFDQHLLHKKGLIDREIAFCRTAEQIQEILQKYANQEAGTDLPIQLLLNPC
jgi:hypothetical protein